MSVKVKKTRVFSAKLTSYQQERVRPFSGVSNQGFHRQELIENTYTSQLGQPSRAVSARPTHSGRYLSGGHQVQKQLLRPTIKPSRKKQQMAEQILTLKQTVNKLVEQLAHQRGKVQMIKRKTSKYSKMLSMQFGNEQQWSSQTVSNHLVTGIKAMYDQLKQKYEQKSKEHEQLLTKALATNYLQLNTYIHTLENNNKELARKLEAFQSQQLLLPVSNESQRQANAFTVAQLKLDRQKQQYRLQEVQGQLKKNQERSKDMQKKTQFLQKLIIEKDNNIHALQMKVKEVSKENGKLKKEVATITANLANIQAEYQRYRDFSTNLQRQLTQSHQLQLQVLKNQKEQSIQALQTNNNYLQEMVGQLRRNNTQLSSEIQNIKEETDRFKVQNHKNNQNPLNSHRTTNNQTKSDCSVLFTVKLCVDSEGKRIPQKADQKHHKEALKKRKVELPEIIQAVQLLKYKMIGQNLTIQQFMVMFDYASQRKYDEDETWSEKYITMRQINSLLFNKPFNLNSQDSLLLARYLIQDVHQQHVYCDQLNQNHRTVVKSILKNLLQSYTNFGSEINTIQKQTNNIITQFGPNLYRALKALQPSGLISHSKFNNVIKSLGIETSQAVEAFLVAKMALQSDNIKKLPYGVLF